MKIKYLSILVLTLTLISFSSFSQSENEDPLLGLPGDDLDLYAVLDLFQKSKTIESFEKSLNDNKEGIVNLDLNNDGYVDFLKVTTEKDGDNFLFILQDPINDKETQDVAVITVSKDSAGKVSMQIIGDEALYGKNYVVEPRTEATESVTSNPAYVGDDPVTINVKGTTEVVVIQSAPVVKYVYSPVYVPYYPPYYYGYYPPYWRTAAVISIGIYRHNHYHYHHNYYGGHSTVRINHHTTYNNYSSNRRNTSNTVNTNIKNGNFKTAGQTGSRPSTQQARRTSNVASTSNRTSTNQSKPQINQSSNRASTNQAKPQASRTSNGASTSNRATSMPSTTQRQATPKASNRASASRSMSSKPTPSAGRSSGGRIR